MKIFLLITSILFSAKSFSQSLQADFSVPSTACLQQNIVLNNQSVGADRYEWDFCQGDLNILPTAKNVITVPGVNISVGIDVVFDGTNWFGFMTSRETNSIKRLDFGPDVYSTPTVVDLGNIGGITPWRPTDIHIVNDNGEWFGFVYGESSNVISRIDFGTSLGNSTTITAEVIITGSAGTGSGLDIVWSGSQWVILYSGTYFLGTAVLNTIRSIPSASEKMLTGNLPGVFGFGDVKLIKDNNNWHGYIPDFNASKFFHAQFGSDILSTPTLTDISGSYIGSLSPYGLDIGVDEGAYIAFLCTLQGPLVKINLGNDLDAAPVSGANIGNLSTLGNTLKMVLVKEKSTWIGASVSFNGGEFLRIDFPNPACTEIPSVLDEENPAIQFSSSGTKYVSLRSFRGNQFDDKHKQIAINSLPAPSIDFSNNGLCYQTPVQFALQSDQTILSNDWSFGDGNVSGMSAPINTYMAPGTYEVSLEIVSQNGCSNVKSKSISIFTKPVAGFSLPGSPALICTNNEFTFTNNTVDAFEGNLSYQWFVDNNPVSVARDLKYTFTSGGDSNVKLSVSIPGCSDETSQPVTGILTGPTVDFSSSGQCETDLITFTNASSGNIAGYFWDFGNGDTSTATSPQYAFPTKGNYIVTLETSGVNGCISSTSKTLSIYSKPLPDFSIELPPFSCSGTPSQFTNTTPNPIDSNIASWTWSFGDENNGTASDKNPLYTYAKPGDYNVSLMATSNFDCSTTTTKLITIQQGPPVNFTNTPACVNQATRFTDESGSDIKAWFWVIGNSTYSFSNPTHVFTTANNYNAQLTVTGNNDCVATTTKVIEVPIPPILSFSFSNACEGQATTFQDTSPAASDPMKLISWDFVGNEGEGSPATYLFESAGTYAVKMNSTQQSGCVYAISKNVIIAPTPQAKFSSNPEWGTPPLAVQFTNQSTGAGTYLWHFNDKNNSTSTEVSPSFRFDDLGDYVVDLTATNVQNCSNTISAKISVIIPSLDLELKELNLIKDPTSGLYRVMVTIKNRSNFILTSADVVVDISGNARIRETITASILPDGEVSQVLTNQIIPSSFFTYLCAELDVANDLDLLNNKKCEPVSDEGVIFLPYPNPSEGQFQFDWISLAEETAHVTIFNSMGQIVVEHDLKATAGVLTQAKFDLRSYSDGTYFFKFNTKSLSKTIPITIVR